jgi:hypothetical protein
MYVFLLLALPCALLAIRPGVSVSRRILAGALVVLIPIAGPVLASMVRNVRGGKLAVEPVRPTPRTRPSTADVQRLGELPPVLERLLARDPAERLAALVYLSSQGDAAAIAVLQWTIEHGPAEIVLEAALTLEEIELRRAPPIAPPVVTVVLPPAASPAPPRLVIAGPVTPWWPRWLRARTGPATAASAA